MQEESWIEHNPQLPPSPINPHRFSALAHTCMLSTEHKFSLLSLFSSCPQPCRVFPIHPCLQYVNGVLQHSCYEFYLLLYFPLGRISMREVKSIDCSVLNCLTEPKVTMWNSFRMWNFQIMSHHTDFPRYQKCGPNPLQTKQNKTLINKRQWCLC